MAIIPEPLKPGNKLAAVSPASPVLKDEFDQGCKNLLQHGYRVFSLPHTLKSEKYLAGTDNQRAEDLQRAFTDPEFDGIICTRGGYGSMRILPLLDYESISRTPKTLIGFSDITALQWALWKKSDLVTFSGPQLVKGWGNDLTEFSQSCWLSAIKGEFWDKPLPDIIDGKKILQSFVAGRASGNLLGGNLAVLSALAGSSFAPQFADAILILEEIDEPDYRIDRMITQLALSGALEHVKGIVIGQFIQHTRNGINNQSNLAASLLSKVLPGVPMLTGAPYGHVEETWTIPIGAEAVLDSESCSLSITK